MSTGRKGSARTSRAPPLGPGASSAVVCCLLVYAGARLAWRGVVWCGLASASMPIREVMWRGVARREVVWRGVVWRGVARGGMGWSGVAGSVGVVWRDGVEWCLVAGDVLEWCGEDVRRYGRVR